jgi:hypothetical protein
MIKVGTRTKSLLLASALSPLTVLSFVIEVKLDFRAYSPPTRGFVLFSVPYQDLLEILFFVGVFAFILFIFSLARDNRIPNRISWLNQ